MQTHARVSEWRQHPTPGESFGLPTLYCFLGLLLELLRTRGTQSFAENHSGCAGWFAGVYTDTCRDEEAQAVAANSFRADAEPPCKADP